MKTPIRLFSVVILAVLGAAEACAADPQVSSWLTLNAEKFAQVYRNDAERRDGVAVTTWYKGRLSQAQPANQGVQEILTSADWIYIRSTGLGNHVMGPWYLDPERRYSFPNVPTDQHMILRLPRHPVAQKGHPFQPLGEIGMFVDGVRMFDANDAFSYSNENGRDADPRAGIGQGDHFWNRDAYVNEGMTFDAALGHQQNWGRYHYHAEPLALRYLLGDHVDFDATTKSYSESKTAVTKHSPILGWMHDGYPIYGPYGFSNATNAASGVRRMVSGYVARNGSSGADDLTKTGRRKLPAWAARELERDEVLDAFESGPDVSQRYPVGHYIEDYAYLGDLGKKQGGEFDLDACNGRWCVTPEFPQGTYAYFTTISAEGKPVYPYNMGRRYYGNPSGRLVKSINEPVTTNFVSHAASSLKTAQAIQTTTLLWTGNSDKGAYQSNPR